MRRFMFVVPLVPRLPRTSTRPPPNTPAAPHNQELMRAEGVRRDTCAYNTLIQQVLSSLIIGVIGGKQKAPLLLIGEGTAESPAS